jgi:hypothetical protein
VSAPRKKTRSERLYSAAVLRRTLELSGPDHRAGFTFVYEGVLRDLAVSDADVREFLEAHGEEVDAAVGRGRGRA